MTPYETTMMRRFVALTLALNALVLALGLILSLPARAHNAPSGWAYDYDCCSTYDCAQVRSGVIVEVMGGYQVVVMPGTHIMVPLGSEPVRAFIPHGDPRIRVSGDANRHACVSGVGRVLCIYVPPGGV